MKVDVELEPFTPLLRPTYADAHAGAISEVRMEGYEFGHTYVWQGPVAAESPAGALYVSDGDRCRALLAALAAIDEASPT